MPEAQIEALRPQAPKLPVQGVLPAPFRLPALITPMNGLAGSRGTTSRPMLLTSLTPFAGMPVVVR